MKRLREWESKKILHRFGFSVPCGLLVREGELFSLIDFPPDSFKNLQGLMIKPQTLGGGRGKANLIRTTPKIREAINLAKAMLGQEVTTAQSAYPEKIENVLIEEKINIEKELYLSFILDRNSERPIISISPEGGIDIEELDESKIKKISVHPLWGLKDYQVRSLVDFCKVEKETAVKLSDLIEKLWKVFKSEKFILMEFNPVALTSKKELVFVDAKIAIDEYALPGSETASVIDFKPAEQRYVKFFGSGDVGLISHGAGVGQVIIDSLYYSGIEIAGFVDIDVGITVTPKELVEIFKLVMADSRVKLIFSRFEPRLIEKETVASALLRLREESRLGVLMIFFLEGCGESALKQINQIEPKKIYSFSNFEEAITKLLEAKAK